MNRRAVTSDRAGSDELFADFLLNRLISRRDSPPSIFSCQTFRPYRHPFQGVLVLGPPEGFVLQIMFSSYCEAGVQTLIQHGQCRPILMPYLATRLYSFVAVRDSQSVFVVSPCSLPHGDACWVRLLQWPLKPLRAPVLKMEQVLQDLVLKTIIGAGVLEEFDCVVDPTKIEMCGGLCSKSLSKNVANFEAGRLRVVDGSKGRPI